MIPEELLHDVTTAAAEHQPELVIATHKDLICLEGKFVVSGPKGPFDFYDIQIQVPSQFPVVEPTVFETGGRIPPIADRHVFEHNKSCCLGVWEEWLLTTRNLGFAAFLKGPLHDYFVSQSWFEASLAEKGEGEWPFGQRAHGWLGILESYCDLLGADLDEERAISYLRLLTQKQIKGHAICPCGSGARLRNCHLDKLLDLHRRIGSEMARRMLCRLYSLADRVRAA